jgi:spore maturation protein CgeB
MEPLTTAPGRLPSQGKHVALPRGSAAGKNGEHVKITIFGLTISSSWGNGHATPYRALVRALHRRGHHVVFYEKDVPYYTRRRDFSSWPYCELVLYPEWSEVRGRALNDAVSSDVVCVASYCPGGAQISDEILGLSRPLRVFYDLDTPITLEKLRNGDSEYLHAGQIPGFDLYLSFTGGPILEELTQVWRARSVRALYGCVDLDLYRRIPARPEYRCTLSYMGTYSADRHSKVEELFLEPSRRLPQSRFLLAGSLYPETLRCPVNVKFIEHLPPSGHPLLYSSSRLTLNVTREGMARYGWCPSGRFFEAAACGTPLLSDYFAGLENFFVPGEELLLVRDRDDVLQAFSLSDEELERQARRARERVLAEHSGERRAQQFLDFCEEASGGQTGHVQEPARRAVGTGPSQPAVLEGF